MMIDLTEEDYVKLIGASRNYELLKFKLQEVLKHLSYERKIQPYNSAEKELADKLIALFQNLISEF